MNKIIRPDFDYSNNIKFLKTERVDIRKSNEYNKKTNAYDYIRNSFEKQAPQPRGYIDLPSLIVKPSIFESQIEKSRERARIFSIALKKELILPLLNENNKIQYSIENETTSGNILTKPYKFEQILYDDNIQMKQYALEYLNNLQDIQFSQSPEYKLMLELLGSPRASVQPVKLKPQGMTQKDFDKLQYVPLT